MKYLPEESKDGLKRASKKRGRVDNFSVSNWVGDRILKVTDHGRKQKRNYSHRTNG